MRGALLYSALLVGILCISLKVWQDATGLVIIWNPHQFPFLHVTEMQESKRECKNAFDDLTCEGYAPTCYSHPGWMLENCPKVCPNFCELMDLRKRCAPTNEKMGGSTEPAYASGDLEAMFLRLEENGNDFGVEIISRDPWLVSLDNFMSDEEVETLINRTEQGMRRSQGQKASASTGIEIESETTISRTSWNSWCIEEECRKDPVVGQITNRIEEITKVPRVNYEHYQVLRYDIGQEYKTHHDLYNSRDNQFKSGPRILTFFLYLSDVEEGGETYFPYLRAKVKPKKGKAVVWANVYNSDPSKGDARTVHASLPVIKGLKFAANTWIHLRDFQTFNNWGCSNAHFLDNDDSKGHLFDGAWEYIKSEWYQLIWDAKINIYSSNNEDQALFKGLYEYF